MFARRVAMKLRLGLPAAEASYTNRTNIRIVSRVHRRGGYNGVIVGKTWCYVDVHIPKLKHQLRVLKRLVREEGLPNGQQAAVNAGWDDRTSCTLAEDPELVAELRLVCEKLVERGVPEGNVGVHLVMDGLLKEYKEASQSRMRRRQ
jgi:hypothetical protein